MARSFAALPLVALLAVVVAVATPILSAAQLQVNDTKSAYNQISDFVNNQFSDGTGATAPPEGNNNNETTTESSKISRTEFLQILDRNLKGLARLRALEWREARKDSWRNLQGYKDEVLGKQKPPNST